MGEFKTNCLLYADDYRLSCFLNQKMVCRCLDRLNRYVKKWQMKININKTKAVIFNISGKIFRSEFKLGNQPIHITESYI